MATYSSAYTTNPHCQAYQAERAAIAADWHRRRAHAEELADWPSAVTALEAELTRRYTTAETTLATRLAADNLRIFETYDPATGYFVDLVAD